MNKICTTYIDESGNTGPNLNDQQQKLFVLAAVTIPKEQEGFVREELQRVFNEGKESDEKELKAISWIKSSKRADLLSHFIDNLMGKGCDFNFVLMEKRFMSCSLIVDNFLDGYYNIIKDYRWCNDKSEKIEAANYFYDTLEDDEVEMAASYFQNPNSSLGHSVQNMLVKKTSEERYLNMIKGCDVEELSLDLQSLGDNEGGIEKLSNSPNHASFAALGMLIAAYCKLSNCKTSLVFDSYDFCNNTYNGIWGVFHRMSPSIVLEKLVHLNSWSNLITGFESKDSRKETLLQTADILATSLLKTIESIVNGDELNEFQKYITIITAMLFAFNKCNDVISKKCRNKIFSNPLFNYAYFDSLPAE